MIFTQSMLSYTVSSINCVLCVHVKVTVHICVNTFFCLHIWCSHDIRLRAGSDLELIIDMHAQCQMIYSRLFLCSIFPPSYRNQTYIASYLSGRVMKKGGEGKTDRQTEVYFEWSFFFLLELGFKHAGMVRRRRDLKAAGFE